MLNKSTSILVSEDVYNQMAKAADSKINIGGYTVDLKACNLFPFQLKYEACCIKTRQRVLIDSRETIHGFAYYYPAISLDLSEDIKLFMSAYEHFKRRAELAFLLPNLFSADHA